MANGHRPTAEVLLTGEALLSAIRGHHVGDRRLAQLAYEFGKVQTETMGTVIDRLAQAQVRAYHLLMTVDDVAAPHVHAAWFRLAELVDEYTDLITAIGQRSRRLPELPPASPNDLQHEETAARHLAAPDGVQEKVTSRARRGGAARGCPRH
ncbi:DUF4254 domain-containing protein [Nocardia sp. NPDC057353]|uniref:DUF4254 domain-containing protein n=1 Tax=Nocardia sp. NPDC057353 TaxID=3346104 RepID=UPI00362ED9AD